MTRLNAVRQRQPAVEVNTPVDTNVTNIIHEPITEAGFVNAYRFDGRSPRSSAEFYDFTTLEVLVPLHEADTIVSHIARLDAGAGKFKGEIVRDAGGASWCIVDVGGPRAAVVDFATRLGQEGFVRRPGPEARV